MAANTPTSFLNVDFIYVGAALSMFGYLSYVRDVRRGKADPDLVTWGLWTVVPLLAFGTQLTRGVGMVALVTFTAGLGPALVFITALRGPHAPYRLHPIDYLCGSTAVVGVFIWISSGNSTLALWAFLAGQLAAGTPTLFKLWFEPDSESRLTYVMDIVTSALVLTTVARFSLATIGFALVEAFVATTALAFAITKIGHRVHGILRATTRIEDRYIIGELPHAHKHLTHYHPVLRPHLPESRPRYFEHMKRVRTELLRANTATDNN